jgi:hypothetical protein
MNSGSQETPPRGRLRRAQADGAVYAKQVEIKLFVARRSRRPHTRGLTGHMLGAGLYLSPADF